MASPPIKHIRTTAALARALKPRAIYEWLVTKGYFPEPYVLPPCFNVLRHAPFGKVYAKTKNGRYSCKVHEFLQIHFPKTDLTDRTFGIIDPEIHSDIAYTVAKNWKTLLRCIFHKDNKVSSYSFPIPVNSRKRGSLGGLRSGRMIYEFLKMAETDLAAICYRYKFVYTTDIKNFYPSVYTHSIAWAIHGKKTIRRLKNRSDPRFFGNRLDKLFQNANDGCTNGIPIGPVVSDLTAEVVLSRVDRILSRSVKKELDDNVVIVRYKDDYRILANTEGQGKRVVKALQSALKEFHLELNEAKTECHKLPDGLFRPWKSQYHFANPNPKRHYSFKRFREVYLSVVKIDRDNPGAGVIDSFLGDLVTRKYHLRIGLESRRLPQIISLLLILGELRTKAFPKVLAIIESILRSPFGRAHGAEIMQHLVGLLQQLCEREPENRYLIAWICYFLRANGWSGKAKSKCKLQNPIVRATFTSYFTSFKKCHDFKVFQGVKTVAKKVSMLEHLDLFKHN